MSEVILEARKCFLWFPIRFTKYSIIKNFDDYELVVNTGLLSQREEKIKLFKINDIGYERTLGNLICGVGNIRVASSDSSSRRITISKIKGYRDFGKQLEDLVYSERKKMNVNYSETNIVR